MYKPIISNEELDLNNLISFIFLTIKKHKFLVGVATIVYLLYSILKSPAYEIKASFYSNYNEKNSISSLSFLQSFSSNNSLEKELGFSIDAYLKSDNFAKRMVNSKFNIEGETVTLTSYFGDYSTFSLNPITTLSNIIKELNMHKGLTKIEKNEIMAIEKLRKNLIHSEDTSSSLHTLSLTVDFGPEFGLKVMKNIIDSISDYFSSVNNSKENEKAAYILQSLNESEINLKEAENKLLNFKERNVNTLSPKLSLEESRLERDIMLKNQLFISLSDQYQLTKVDEADSTTPIFLLDEPQISSYKPGLPIFQKLLIFSTLLILLIMCYDFIKHRKILVI